MNSFFLYIDPGTGSMLFSIIIGLATTAVFMGRAVLIRLKAAIGRGKVEKHASSSLGIVIYTDSKRYWPLFEPLCREFERRKIPLVYFTQSPDDPALSGKFSYVRAEYIGGGNAGLARMNFLNADICLSTTPDVGVLQWKRSRDCRYYIFLAHAVDEMLGYRMFSLDFFDALFLTGDFQKPYIRRIEALRSLPPKELVTVGYPLMDAQAARLAAAGEKPDAPCTVLVAPSWGPSSILSRFGEEFLRAVRATGFNVIVRPHPQSLVSERPLIDALMKEFPDDASFSWNFDNDNFECMRTASVLISDFSGIVFDFALVFDKPVIYADTAFDAGIYDAAWLGDEKLWRFSALEKIGIALSREHFAGMRQVIEGAVADTVLAEGRKEIREQAWMFRGDSARLIADALIAKQSELAGGACSPVS